jgi:hypothetical protein
MNKKHTSFMYALIHLGDKVKAYQLVYPGTADESAKTAANRMLRNHPEIEAAFKASEERHEQEAKAKADAAAQQRAEERVAGKQRKREFLCKMMFGEIKTKKNIKFKDRTEEVENDMSPFAMLRAMELDSKLEDGYDWGGRKEPKDLRELEEKLKAYEEQESSGETLILIGDKPFESDWGRFYRYDRWLKEKPSRQTADDMAYRAKFTLPMTPEEFFCLHPEEVLAPKHRPPGWEKAVRGAKCGEWVVNSEQRIAGDQPSLASPLAGDSFYNSSPVGRVWEGGNREEDYTNMENVRPSKPQQPIRRSEELVTASEKTSKPEQIGTVFSKHIEQHSVINNTNPKPDIKKVIKTGKIPPDTDLWELFLALNPDYKHRMAGLLHCKEEQFRALPRKNQWQWIKPTWDGLHGYKLHEHMPKQRKM